MIRIGLKTEFEFVPEAARIGFDYLELPLQRIAALSDDEFAELRAYAEALEIRAEVMYDMLPDSLRVTGPLVSARQQHEYLEKAFARAKRLGAEVIVFDAPISRNMPAGCDFMLARRQAGNFLRIVQGHASGFDLQVAIQNIRPAECNLINTVSEAALAAALLQLNNVGVMADTVQMALTAEPLETLSRASSALLHVHTGCAVNRALPSLNDGEDYTRLFRLLHRIGYIGRVSATTAGSCTRDTAYKALDTLRYIRDNALV